MFPRLVNVHLTIEKENLSCLGGEEQFGWVKTRMKAQGWRINCRQIQRLVSKFKRNRPRKIPLLMWFATKCTVHCFNAPNWFTGIHASSWLAILDFRLGFFGSCPAPCGRNRSKIVNLTSQILWLTHPSSCPEPLLLTPNTHFPQTQIKAWVPQSFARTLRRYS